MCKRADSQPLAIPAETQQLIISECITWHEHLLTRKDGLKKLARVAQYLASVPEYADVLAYESPYYSFFNSVLCSQCERYAVLCVSCDNCDTCCACSHCPVCSQPTENLCERCGYCTDDNCCECQTCESCENRFESVCSHCNCCDNHCECVFCGRCNSVCNDNYCSDCERCNDCCRCAHCNSCGESCDSTCGECDACTSCCNCSKGPRYDQNFSKHKPENLVGYQINKLRRLLSLELEYSSVGSAHALLSYAEKTGAGIVEDGSLDASGFEINTNPASGDLYLNDVADLHTAVRRSGADVCDACGFHVHVDASDYTQHDIRRLMLLWLAIEPVMFELVESSRFNNTYCKPCGEQFAAILTSRDTQNWRQKLAHGIYYCIKDFDVKKLRDIKSEKYGAMRYAALNIHSFFYRKTFEFRLHGGTTDVATIKNWPLVCGYIVEYALRRSEAQILALICSNLTSEDILLECLPSPELREWILETRRDDENVLMRTARYTVKDFINKFNKLPY